MSWNSLNIKLIDVDLSLIVVLKQENLLHRQKAALDTVYSNLLKKICTRN